MHNPDTLVGRTVLHKFQVENGEEEWFTGFILGYNPNTHLHEIAYDGEEEHCLFNLHEDLSRGDLIIKSD